LEGGAGEYLRSIEEVGGVASAVDGRQAGQEGQSCQGETAGSGQKPVVRKKNMTGHALEQPYIFFNTIARQDFRVCKLR
jgi:hypothetical protein